MAKTNGKKSKKKSREHVKSLSEETYEMPPRLPTKPWSVDMMIAALDSLTMEESFECAKSAGILDENGRLTEFYTRDDPHFISRACDDVYLSHTS